MSDNLIRCVHENGKVCFLTKAATENRAFMKKYGIRVEHVEKKKNVETIVIDATEVKHVLGEAKRLKTEGEVILSTSFLEPNSEAEAEAIDKQIADALAESKPKQTRTRSTKPRTKTNKR